MSDPAAIDNPLNTFSDFIRAVPEKWRGCPVYVRDSIGGADRAVTLCLDRDRDGRKIIIVSQTFTKLKG